MTEKLATSNQRYERPVIRAIGEREMFESAGVPTGQSYDQAEDQNGAVNPAVNPYGWCWPGGASQYQQYQYWPWGGWPSMTAQASAADEETSDLRTPLYRMIEEEDGFRVYVELPGADPDDIDLYVGRTDVVVTTAARDGEEAGDGLAESYYGTLEFDEELDPDAIETSYANGVLHLKLLKSKSGSRRHLKVSPAR
jgi:HSP20 family molecular chaperone IbpA